MTTPETITSEIQKLNPSAIIELYELDLQELGGDLLRFHNGTNELYGSVVWNGDTYEKYPILVSGFEFNTNRMPTPKMQVGNTAGVVTAYMMLYNDLIGAKLTRIRTLAKYLDAVNFTSGVNPEADPTAVFPRDIYFIDRLVVERKDIVEFELAAAMDLQGVFIPRRQIIQNLCAWIYRSAECGYTGTSYFDSNDVPVTSSTQDKCGKRLSSCQARFGESAELPYGGFPGAGLLE